MAKLFKEKKIIKVIFFSPKNNYWHPVFIKMCPSTGELVPHPAHPSHLLSFTVLGLHLWCVLLSLSLPRPPSVAKAAGPSVSYESATLALINSD